MLAHQVLRIPELVQHIFSHLQPVAKVDWPVKKHARENRQALLHAALACTAFLEPALDVLWRELNSVEAAIVLLPSVQIGVQESANVFTSSALASRGHLAHDPRYLLLRNPTTEEWARFRYYAKRVHKIHLLSGADNHTQRDKVLTSLLNLFEDGQLFASLHDLHCTLEDSLDRSFLSLVSPALKALRLDVLVDRRPQNKGIDRHDHNIKLLITEVTRSAPFVVSFVTPRHRHPSALAPLHAWSSLRCIKAHIVTCDTSFLRGLSGLTGLTGLDLEISSLSTDFVGTPGFLALENLSLIGFSDTITIILPTIQSEHVRDVHLKAVKTGHDSLGCYREIIGVIATKFSGLRHLSVNFWAGTETTSRSGFQSKPSSTSDAFCSTFAPLARLHKLEEAAFNLPVSLRPASPDILRLLKSWGRLEVLEFGFDRIGHVPHRSAALLLEDELALDRTFLIDVMGALPHLRSLTLPCVNFMAECTQNPQDAPSWNQLEVLDLTRQSSKITGEVDETAAYLARLFPCLRVKSMRELESYRRACPPFFGQAEEDTQWFSVLEVLAAHKAANDD